MRKFTPEEIEALKARLTRNNPKLNKIQNLKIKTRIRELLKGQPK